MRTQSPVAPGRRLHTPAARQREVIVTPEQRDSGSVNAVNLGLAANALLAVLKTGFGILGGSPALLADGINSTADVAYFAVVRVCIHLARRPADPQHPYGHSQMESIAALVVGSFVITTAITIFWGAVNSVYALLTQANGFEGAALSTLWVALFTIVAKLWLTAYTQRVGQRARNVAVLALAYDHRNDVFSASAAAIGIYLGRMGLPWVDPLAGALVSLLILRTGIEILRESSADLMDTVPGHSLDDQIRAIASAVPGVEQVEEVRAHRFGPYLVLALTVGVEGSLIVVEGDRIASEVERALFAEIDLLRRVIVHYHPTKLLGPGATPA